MSDILRSRPDCERWQAPLVGRDKTRQRADSDVADVAKKAREDGFRLGKAQGLAAAAETIAAQQAALQSLIDALQSPLEALDNEVVDAVSRLAISIARRLIRRELRANPDEVVGVVREALAVLPLGLSELRLHLHPDDARLVTATLAPAEDAAAWQIVEDPVITRGGCRISSSSSQVDATVESRMASVINTVLGDEREEDEQSE